MTFALLGTLLKKPDRLELSKINQYNNKQNCLDYFLLGEPWNFVIQCSAEAENVQSLFSCELLQFCSVHC